MRSFDTPGAIRTHDLSLRISSRWAFSNRSKPPKSLGFWWRGSKSNYNHDQTGNGKDIRVAEMLLGCLFVSAHSISSISPATMVAEIQRRNSG